MGFVADRPDLAVQWHPTLNGELAPENVTLGSNRTIWWVCSIGHNEYVWSAKPNSRKNALTTACPVCSGKVAMLGFNDLTTVAPTLAEEWHPTRNGSLTPGEFTGHASRTVWWQCSAGHEWEAEIGYRIREGLGCPICVSLEVLHPDLAAEWHPTLNGELTPTRVRANSGVKVWWLGKECGHEWEAEIRGRVRSKYGCPFCVNQRVLPGFNDLATTHPEIAAEWHPTKNGGLTPENVTKGSKRKVWWLGKDCRHEWEASVRPRTSKDKVGCGVCRGLQVQVGVNDLVTTNPLLATEWHPTRNGGLTPENVTKGSKRKVWWVCEDCGHEWKTCVGDRGGVTQYGCPACAAKTFVSKPEQEIADSLTQLGISVETTVRNVIKGELDIYVPEKNVAVEFNGLYWHSELFKNRTYHYDKWKACKDAGIQLIQVWEDDWNRNPSLVKRMLAHKLGVAGEPKIFARKTRIKNLSQKETNPFLTQNHIQGAVDGSIRLGLTVQDAQTTPEGSRSVERLVAVMVLKKEPGTDGRTLNLLRFATSQPVVGGFTKLLKHAELTGDIEEIITFSDNTVSDGGLYGSTGFVVEKELNPDYMYLVKGERKHKFGYRLKKFREDPKLKYEKGLTENELALLNNIPRVWDAGKTKWVKQKT